MVEKICEIKDTIKKQKPLVHCITNPISINQCANAILTLFARPIMAEHPKEVSDVTENSNALMLNIGNITDARMESIIISAKTAKSKGIPILLDVVGVACSKFRREYVKSILLSAVPSVVKGNYSEIKALYDEEYFSPGVDADFSSKTDEIATIAVKLAEKYKTVILATGEIDVVTNGKNTVCVKNGISQMANITGTGCMLGAVCATFMTAASPMEASIYAAGYFGICGELSKTEKGNGSFKINLLDKISTLKRDEILKHLRLEEFK